MALSAFIIMSALEAARFRDLTISDTNRLDPVEVRGGFYKGKYALPASLKTNPVHQKNWIAFAMCDEVAIDTAIGFPEYGDEGRAA